MPGPLVGVMGVMGVAVLELLEVLPSVPFGSVPLRTIVLVPFTSAMFTRLLFNEA